MLTAGVRTISTWKEDERMASPALYWHGRVLSPAFVSELLPSAKQVLQDEGLTDIRQSNVDVSGRTANTHAAIALVQVGNAVALIVIVGGTINEETQQVRKKLSDAVDKW